jgi:hypothetical protein
VVPVGSNHVLRLFCDQNEPDSDNYVIYTPQYSYIVSRGSQLLRESKDRT